MLRCVGQSPGNERAPGCAQVGLPQHTARHAHGASHIVSISSGGSKQGVGWVEGHTCKYLRKPVTRSATTVADILNMLLPGMEGSFTADAMPDDRTRF